MLHRQYEYIFIVMLVTILQRSNIISSAATSLRVFLVLLLWIFPIVDINDKLVKSKAGIHNALLALNISYTLQSRSLASVSDHATPLPFYILISYWLSNVSNNLSMPTPPTKAMNSYKVHTLMKENATKQSLFYEYCYKW